MSARRFRLAILAVAACGDNRRAPAPLVDDPAVEVGCRPGPISGTRAKVVACGQELIHGRLASGRIGDFVLENEHLRAIVRGPGQGYYLHGTSGGGLIDLVSQLDAQPGEDLVKEILPAIDFSAGGFEEFAIVEAGDDGAAELVVRGPAVGVDIVQAAVSREVPNVLVEHHYRLAAGAKELELTTRVFAQDGNGGSELHDLLFLGGRAPAFLPGKGFDSGAAGGEVIASAGTTTSYGLVYPVGAPNPQLIDLAGIRLVTGPDTDDRGTTRYVIVGDGSVASVTERAWQLRETPLGAITGTTLAGAEIAVDQAGAPITIGRADAQGAFRIAVPLGEYVVQARGLGLVPSPGVPVAVDGDVTVTLPEPVFGTLALDVRDETGHPIPARVVLAQPGVDDRIEWVGSTGAAMLRVEPGTWRVSVSRGLEYEAFVADQLVVGAGENVMRAVTLQHVVDTGGWISLDTHLHSELSTDSTLPIDDRLRAVAGEGVDVAVSTDHDVVVDYAPIILELGLQNWMGSMVGCETSSLVFGHVNGFPLAVDPDRTGGGAVRWHRKAPREVFAGLRRNSANRIVQVNHPRDGDASLFDSLELDPVTLEVRRDPAALGLPVGTDLSDLSFDAVEVANASSADDFEQVFEDYLAMVAAGHPACATGSSDSHGASRFAGAARTFVFVGAGRDDPAALDADAIVAAIKARHVVVGTGAFVIAGIVKHGATSLPGDTTDLTGDATVTLRVKVQAASWQPTARIRIYEGRNEIRAIELDANDTAPVRFDQDVVLAAPTASTFWVVRVDMGGPGDPVLGDSMPSFTNPVFGRID
jgi:hypothetical protein